MQFFPFTAAILLALIAASLFGVPSVYQRSNRILAALLAVLSLQMFGVTARFYSLSPDAYMFNSVLAMCLGPLVYLYLRDLVNRELSKKAKILHALPAVISPLMFYFSRNTPLTQDLFIIVSLIIYSSLSATSLFGKGRSGFRSLPQNIQNFARFCLAFIVSVTCVDILIYFEIGFLEVGDFPLSLSLVTLIFAALSLLAAWSLLSRAEMVAWIFKRRYQAMRANSSYLPDHHDEVIKKLDTLIENEQVHLDPEINLKSLAQAVGVPDRLLSNTINQQYNKTLRRYINDLRIEEAKRQLCDTDKDVLSIMFSVGYQTKSNFYREFFNAEGCSPNEYRKIQRAKN